ncbi:MAG TPA: hypothetical protein ENJ82_01015 [Bacteroidetes bacterium]|nr:hypothetical protein [Bacteroidota bacterium]
MPRHDRRYRSRFRKDPDDENFTLSNYERKPFDLSRKMVLWTPIVIAILTIWYFIHDYFVGG